MTSTTVDLLAAALARDPSGPLFTHYDDRTGERVELSASTLDNWVAKTANLLADGAGLGAGDRAAVLLPPHWQTAAVMLGCWAAGLAVAHGVRGAAPDHADVAFAAADRAGEATGTGAPDVYLLSLAPLGARLREVPAGTQDYAVEVPAYGDRFVPVSPVTGATAALVGSAEVDHAGLVAAARERATELGLSPGDRLLVAASADHRPRPLDWLAVPLVAGASVVLVRDPDPAALARRAADERVTATLGVQVPGVRHAG
ncbi:MAG TPA: TIGR03089 family protein [Mycobacteriales bacterium]